MKLTVDGVDHDVDLEKMPFDEACSIEDVTGQTIHEWSQAIEKGSAKAMRALALVLMQRIKPETRWADIGQLDFMDFLRQLRSPDPATEEGVVHRPSVDPSVAASELPGADTSGSPPPDAGSDPGSGV